MIVDDDKDNTIVIKKSLELQGYQVDIFDNPFEALKQFEDNSNNNNNPYDKIVIDIGMPDMNGFDLARKIWTIDANAQICFLSSFEINENEAKKVFPNLKTRCFMTKPITPNILSKHFQSHLIRPNRSPS